MPRAVVAAEEPRKKRVYKKSAARVKYVTVPAPRIRGRGAYTYGDQKRMGPFETAGRFIGRSLGSSYGAGGAALGEKLGSYLHYIGKIFGSGDYVTSPQVVSHNSLTKIAPQAPMFTGLHAVNIKHREFMSDIYSSNSAGAFNLQAFAINAGVSTTFQWLSQVCGATFQQYRINGMVFEYRSMSSDALNSTNTALGTVVMATDYDSTDRLFTSKAEMENSEFGVSCKPSQCMIHAIECKRSLTAISELYIRANAAPAGADPRLYDLGNFQIATVGCQGTNVQLGELWVSYDIDLIKTIQQPPGWVTRTAAYTLTPTGGSWNTAPLGAVGSQVLFDNDNWPVTFVSGNAFTLPYNIPAGTSFVVTYAVSGASTAVSPPSVTASNGLTIGQTFGNNSGTFVSFSFTSYVSYDGSGTPAAPPTITIGNYTGPASATSGLFYVNQINSLFDL